METAIYFFILLFFVAISWACVRYCVRKEKKQNNYGEEHRPYVDKYHLKNYKYPENGAQPAVKDIGFPPKEYGLHKETKYQKQRSSCK